MSYADSFARVLTRNDLTHSGVKTGKDFECVEFGMKLSNTRIKVYSFFEGPIVSTRIFGFATVPENKYGEAILECNSLNDEYKFAKFYIDKDKEVVISMDAYLDENSAGEEAYKTAMVLIEIAEEAYPKLQKAIWA